MYRSIPANELENISNAWGGKHKATANLIVQDLGILYHGIVLTDGSMIAKYHEALCMRSTLCSCMGQIMLSQMGPEFGRLQEHPVLEYMLYYDRQC